MPRTYALIPCDIWRRDGFRGLQSYSQLVYFVIRTSPTTSRAGVSVLRPELWGSGASLGATAVVGALDDLDQAGLIVRDEENDEVFVPDCIRHEEADRNRNILERVIRDAEAVRSPLLRSLIAVELRDLGLSRSAEAADFIERGELVPPNEAMRLSWVEREHLRVMRRRFTESAGRRRLRAEIDAGIHACHKCRSTEALQVDHIVALARGGTNELSNFQVLCAPCNSRKGAR